MTKEIIDGYEVEVTESKNFLTEVEEAALLLLDPSYFGTAPQAIKLTGLEIQSMTNGTMPKWSHSVARPSKSLSDTASRLSEVEIKLALTKLASRTQPMCVVRLRCGELYCGSALNYFYKEESKAS